MSGGESINDDDDREPKGTQIDGDLFVEVNVSKGKRLFLFLKSVEILLPLSYIFFASDCLQQLRLQNRFSRSEGEDSCEFDKHNVGAIEVLLLVFLVMSCVHKEFFLFTHLYIHICLLTYS